VSDGGQNEIEVAGKLPEHFGLARVHELVRTEGSRLSLFGRGGGEGGNFRSKGMGKLQGKVSQSADANDSDARGRIDAVSANRIVDGDSTAEKWRGALAVDPVGNGNNEAMVDADTIGISAVAMNASTLTVGAKVLRALQAPLAMPAAVGLPARSDSITGVQAEDRTPGYGDSANDFVAGNERVLADAPIVVDQMNVAAADAAMRDGNLHVMLLEIAGFVLVRQKLGARGMRGESLDHGHNRSPLAMAGWFTRY
jgi:hypothetical protein